jgi:hypothetical protein
VNECRSSSPTGKKRKRKKKGKAGADGGGSNNGGSNNNGSNTNNNGGSNNSGSNSNTSNKTSGKSEAEDIIARAKTGRNLMSEDEEDSGTNTISWSSCGVNQIWKADSFASS